MLGKEIVFRASARRRVRHECMLWPLVALAALVSLAACEGAGAGPGGGGGPQPYSAEVSIKDGTVAADTITLTWSEPADAAFDGVEFSYDGAPIVNVAAGTTDVTLTNGISDGIPVVITIRTISTDGQKSPGIVLTMTPTSGMDLTFVSDAASLQSLGVDTTDYSILIADIDLDGVLWTPIGSTGTPFRGWFDGNGHVISNLSITASMTENVGLFGVTDGAQIRRVALESLSLTGGNSTGGLIGSDTGSTIEFSHTTGSVVGQVGTGGLVGAATGTATEITDSYSTASVTGTGRTGGLAGSTDGTVILRSHGSGSVSSPSGTDTGGLVGLATGTTVSNSFATGTVTTNNQTAGGLIGYAEGSSVTESFATGGVNGGTGRAGGLVGELQGSSSVTDSYARGSVTADAFAGGLVGIAVSGTSIQDSYAAGVMTAASGFGLMGGSVAGTVEAVFALERGTDAFIGLGTPTVTDSGLLNAAAMTQGASYTGWDFVTVWDIAAGVNNGWPFLRNSGI